MAARPIASITISFGLVSIPVKLFSATEASRAISFNLLHKACGSRLRQQYFCVKEDVPVSREDMVKGYEFTKDQYVVFTPEELKALEEAGTQTADITEFVPYEEVAPGYQDVMKRIPDLTKQRELLEFTPEIDLREGIKRLWAWYEKVGKTDQPVGATKWSQAR